MTTASAKMKIEEKDFATMKMDRNIATTSGFYEFIVMWSTNSLVRDFCSRANEFEWFLINTWWYDLETYKLCRNDVKDDSELLDSSLIKMTYLIIYYDEWNWRWRILLNRSSFWQWLNMMDKTDFAFTTWVTKIAVFLNYTYISNSESNICSNSIQIDRNITNNISLLS